MSEQPQQPVHRRRPRYRGSHPRRFEQKYKELAPDKYPATIEKVLASGKTPAGSHRPVCLNEVLEVLAPKPGDTAVDATLGYGGHAMALLRAILPGGRLIAFDSDPIELPKAEERLRAITAPAEALLVIHSNFAGMHRHLADRGISGADVLLADLGCSSMQLDDPSRGFSFKLDGPLDLRMNPGKGRSAAQLLAALEAQQVSTLLKSNADEPHSNLIAEHLCQVRSCHPISTTRQLAQAIRDSLKKGARADAEDSIRRVFQALRVAVNEEYTALETFLRFLPSCLNPGGRVSILTFHSGEDRRVKKAFQEGERNGIYSQAGRQVIRPSAEEIHGNPRASSAKLRWAIRSLASATG